MNMRGGGGLVGRGGGAARFGAAPAAPATGPGGAADAGGGGDQLHPDPSPPRQLPRADDGREPGERSRHGRAAAQDLRAGGTDLAAAGQIYLGAAASRFRLLL